MLVARVVPADHLELAGGLVRDPPPAVAEVVADLPVDERPGEGGQRVAAIGVEAIDGLDQPDRAGLDEVVEMLARAARVAARDGLDERQVLFDDARASLLLGASLG